MGGDGGEGGSGVVKVNTGYERTISSFRRDCAKRCFLALLFTSRISSKQVCASGDSATKSCLYYFKCFETMHM